MSEPYLAEIRIMSFNFAPRGWAQCNGQLLPIAQNQALFSLLGTTYGGDGRVNFALPELRGRAPIHVDFQSGSQFPLGGRSGAETVTLTTAELPSHTHQLNGSNQPETQTATSGNYLATHASNNAYAPPTSPNLTTMISNEVTNTGGGQGHNNMQPFLVLNMIIALQGIFPPRN